MQQEDPVHRLCQDGADLAGLTRVAKHHVQKVLGVIQLIVRIHEGLTRGELVAHSSQSRHFGYQSKGSNLSMLFVRNFQ